MTNAELRVLAEVMNRWFGMPKGSVPSRAVHDALTALEARGLVTETAGVWRHTEAGTRAYVDAVLAEAGLPSPWADSSPTET